MKRGLLLLLILIFVIGCSSNVQVEVAPVREKMMAPAETIEETETVSEVKEISVVAKKFSFNPDSIIVNQGDKVKLLLTSEDVEHGFAISEYGINEKVNKGETKTIEFTADKAGEFEIRCSVVCGSGHSGMKGKLIVNWKCSSRISIYRVRRIHFIEKEKKCLKNTAH